jgi:hypothetical protein
MTRLYVILIAVVLTALLMAGSWWAGDRYRAKADSASQVAGIAANEVQTQDAAKDKAHETQDLHEFILAQPTAPVRVCRAAVQTIPKADPGTSAGPEVAAGVHGADTPVRPEPDTPDIRPVLTAFAALFAAKNIDLIEQQAVK